MYGLSNPSRGLADRPRGLGTRLHVLVPVGLTALVLSLAVHGAMAVPAKAVPAVPAVPATVSSPSATVGASGEVGSLEAAATKAGETGRKVAMSLIGLGFAIAAVVLAFRRNFKEATGVFAVGFVAILLATPTGVNVLHDTVNSLFGQSS